MSDDGIVSFPLKEVQGLDMNQQAVARKMAEQFVQGLWMNGIVLKGLNVVWMTKDRRPAINEGDIATGFNIDLDFFVQD